MNFFYVFFIYSALKSNLNVKMYYICFIIDERALYLHFNYYNNHSQCVIFFCKAKLYQKLLYQKPWFVISMENSIISEKNSFLTSFFKAKISIWIQIICLGTHCLKKSFSDDKNSQNSCKIPCKTVYIFTYITLFCIWNIWLIDISWFYRVLSCKLTVVQVSEFFWI